MIIHRKELNFSQLQLGSERKKKEAKTMKEKHTLPNCILSQDSHIEGKGMWNGKKYWNDAQTGVPVCFY